MPLARHKHTGEVRDYPQSIIDHRVLGQNLEPYEPEDDEFEEDKVVVDKKVVPTARPRSTQVAADTEIKKDEDAGA